MNKNSNIQAPPISYEGLSEDSRFIRCSFLSASPEHAIIIGSDGAYTEPSNVRVSSLQETDDGTIWKIEFECVAAFETRVWVDGRLAEFVAPDQIGVYWVDEGLLSAVGEARRELVGYRYRGRSQLSLRQMFGSAIRKVIAR